MVYGKEKDFEFREIGVQILGTTYELCELGCMNFPESWFPCLLSGDNNSIYIGIK